MARHQHGRKQLEPWAVLPGEEQHGGTPSHTCGCPVGEGLVPGCVLSRARTSSNEWKAQSKRFQHNIAQTFQSDGKCLRRCHLPNSFYVSLGILFP